MDQKFIEEFFSALFQDVHIEYKREGGTAEAQLAIKGPSPSVLTGMEELLTHALLAASDDYETQVDCLAFMESTVHRKLKKKFEEREAKGGKTDGR